MKAKGDLKAELIESIQNERRPFRMDRWVKDSAEFAGAVPNCRTALCMAGHICALRPRLAKHILSEGSEAVGRYLGVQGESCGIEYDELAAEIWERETGEKCRLDFFAHGASKAIEEITRSEAVAHIRGRSRRWPLLPK